MLQWSCSDSIVSEQAASSTKWMLGIGSVQILLMFLERGDTYNKSGNSTDKDKGTQTQSFLKNNVECKKKISNPAHFLTSRHLANQITVCIPAPLIQGGAFHWHLPSSANINWPMKNTVCAQGYCFRVARLQKLWQILIWTHREKPRWYATLRVTHRSRWWPTEKQRFIRLVSSLTWVDQNW